MAEPAGSDGNVHNELAEAKAKIDALVAHHEKTKCIYTQLADMYEKLRVEYASALKMNGELSHALANEKAETGTLRSECAQLKERLTEMEERKDVEQDEAVHVEPDDLNEDMMMPAQDDDENELQGRITKLEGEKADLHALLDEVEKELEAEQDKGKQCLLACNALKTVIEERDRELVELRKRASRSIGVRELEELVNTKVQLAELQGERIQLLHDISVLSRDH